MGQELFELGHGHTEFRVRARCAHMMMMATANTRIDACKDLAIAKQIRPSGQRVQIIDSDAYAPLKRPRVFSAWRKVGCIENPSRIQVRKQLQCPLNLATRDAL